MAPLLALLGLLGGMPCWEGRGHPRPANLPGGVIYLTKVIEYNCASLSKELSSPPLALRPNSPEDNEPRLSVQEHWQGRATVLHGLPPGLALHI